MNTPSLSSLVGLTVYLSEHAVTRRWIFPEHRFFKWEPKDEKFCRKYGIGREGPLEPCVMLITEPGSYRKRIIMHPDLKGAIENWISEHDVLIA